MVDHPYEQYAEADMKELDPHLTVQLSELVKQAAQQEERVREAEAALRREQARLRELTETAIPETMEQLGVHEIKTRTGRRVSIKESLRANIAKANQDAAFDWLREHGLGSIIKRQVVTEFGMGQEADAEEAVKRLGEYHPNVKVSVHPNTLSANLKELLERGEDVPLDLFSVFRQRVAKID